MPGSGSRRSHPADRVTYIPLEVDSDSGPVADVAFSPDGGRLAVAAFRRLDQKIDRDNEWDLGRVVSGLRRRGP